MSDIITNLPLPKTRSLYFYEGVDQYSISKITQDIININEDDDFLVKVYDVYGLEYTPKPINIYIDSYGGQVYQILGLVGVMDASMTPIHTYVTGCAMSSGFIMLIAGHKRFAYKHATVMYHQVSNWAIGTLEEMKETVAQTKVLQNQLQSIIADKTKLTKKLMKDYDAKKSDWYMLPSEALQYGIIDEIVQ